MSDTATPETEVMQSETIVLFGDAVKALGDGKIGGYLVRYGSPEQTDISPMRDYFTAETDFDIEDGAKSTVYYQHGLDPVLKRRKLGTATLKRDEFGVWAEAQLDVRDKYEQFIYQMAENGKMGWSSGVPSHLVEREQVGTAHHIKHWPLGKDASLTPNPAEPRNAALPLKSLTINPLELPEDEPEALTPETADAVVDAVSETASTVVEVEIVSSYEEGENAMSELNQNTPPVDERMDHVEASIKAIADKFDAFMNKLEQLPQAKNPGYFTVDGGTADKEVKSLGDFLMAVKRGDVKRLEGVYNTKTLSEDQGATGGYLVPEEYQASLLAVVNQTSGIVPLVRSVNVGAAAGKWPALDQFFTPTAGQGRSAFAGGLDASVTAEAGTFTETEPSFEMLEWRVNKIGGVTYVATELMTDSPMSIESLLTQYVGVAIANKEEYFIFRGSGVGQPLGILNSPALISTGPDTNSTFAYADAVEILSRFKSVGGSPSWFMHPSTLNDLLRFEIGTGGAVFVNNLQGNVPMSLFGYPVRMSEHLPQTDNAGHVLLVDPTAYLLFRKSGVSIAYSEHAAFATGRVAWRFEERLDGQPALRSAITLADPQGSYTVSPFSAFND